MKLSDLKINPNNPRLIKDARFKKLCNSVRDFPKMMALRPIVNVLEYRNISGIYAIFNLLDDRIYIGSSISIGERIMLHKRVLNANKHHSRHLQNFYNKYGLDQIGFAMLAEVKDASKENLINEEQKFLDILKPEFNTNIKADSRLGLINSPETRRKISETRLAMGIKYDDEYKKRMSLALSGKNNAMYGLPKELSPNWGKKHRPETIQKMKKSHHDVKGKNNPKYGIPQSKEATEKALITRRQRHLAKGLGIRMLKDGQTISIFSSSGEATEVTGLCQSSILRVCNGQRRQCKGFTFEFTGVS